MALSGATDPMSPSAVQADRGLHYLTRHSVVYSSHGVAIATTGPPRER
jgi:hypothetical protein